MLLSIVNISFNPSIYVIVWLVLNKQLSSLQGMEMDGEKKKKKKKKIVEEEVHEVVIVGAGIAGLAVALALKSVGITSLVLEKSS